MAGTPRMRLFLLALLSGCGQNTLGLSDEELPPDTNFPLTIAASAPRIDAGAISQFQVENASEIELGFNLCVSGALERYTSGGWKLLAHPHYPCPMLLQILGAGATTTLVYTIPDDAPPGLYRFRVSFTALVGSESIVRRSDPFVVH